MADLSNPVYTIQPVVKPIEQPVEQPVGCLFTRCSQLFKRLFNRFDNRLYRVSGVLASYNELTRINECTPSDVDSWCCKSNLVAKVHHCEFKSL